MTENPLFNTTINSLTTLIVNPEAHTARQLLHRRSSDEADDNDDDEEEEGDEEAAAATDEEEEEDKDEEIEEENGDITLVTDFNKDHVNHSLSPTKFSSSASYAVPVGRGRGSRIPSMVTILLY
jgi:hypothetical protein